MWNSLLSIANINVITAPTNVYNDLQSARIQAAIQGNSIFSSDQVNTINTIFTCKKILTETLSKLPIQILKAGKKYKEHKYYNLVRYSPNSYQTSNVFFSTQVGHLMDTGNAFAKINKSNGNVTNLQIKHPSLLQGYELNASGVLFYKFIDETINSEDLLHFKIFSDNGITGEHPITALNRLLSINHQANQTIDSYYRNGLHTSKAMKSMSNVNVKEYNQAQSDWAKSHTGTIKAGEIINLPFGTEIQELQLQFADAELISTVKYNTSQIAALYGIPAYMLGLENNPYKSVEEALLAFQVQTIQPLAMIFKEELSRKLLTENERLKEDISIEFNLKAMLAADSVTRANYLKTLKDSSIISANQAAEIEGYESYEGGQYHYQQSQYQPLELITKNGEFKPITNGTTINVGGNEQSK